jgi:putative ABC transport system ATP-binding protein
LSTASAGDELVVVRGLEKVYRSGTQIVHALAGVDLVVRAGEFIAIVGTSGSGKTTLLNCMSGLDDFDGGSVAIDGVDVATLSESERTRQRASSLAFVFQNANLLTAFTAHENVALPMILIGAPPKDARQRARAALERVGMEHRLEHFPAELSGGEQQRVAIARALVKRPRIVFADEPTGNLDTHSAAEIMTLLRELRADGTTLILVTHDPSIAAEADRRLEVRDGRIVGDRARSGG